MSLFGKTQAKILSAMESRVMPQWFEQSDISTLFLYRDNDYIPEVLHYKQYLKTIIGTPRAKASMHLQIMHAYCILNYFVVN